jgi:hypothetical protein
MTTAEKTDQKSRIGNICSISSSFFSFECSRLGIPSTEEDALRLIERCFISAQVMVDYLDDKTKPFI